MRCRQPTGEFWRPHRGYLGRKDARARSWDLHPCTVRRARVGYGNSLDLDVSHAPHNLSNHLLGPIVGGFIGISGASWRQVLCIASESVRLTHYLDVQLAILGPHAFRWLMSGYDRFHPSGNVRTPDTEAQGAEETG